MDPLLLVPLVLGLLAPLPFLWRGWRRSQARRAWLALAPRLELLLNTEGGRRFLVGRYQGHLVEVWLTPTGTARLCMKSASSEVLAGLRLLPRESAPHRFWRPREIRVGEPALDAAFCFHGYNPAAVIRLMREPDVGPALLALHADNPRARLSETEAVALLTYPLEEDSCRRILKSLSRVISALERFSHHQSDARVRSRDKSLQDWAATWTRR